MLEWAPIVLTTAQDVTMTFDWGAISTAWAPTVTIIVSAVIAALALRRTRKRDKEDLARQAKAAAETAAKILKQGADTYVLVNDQLTREKKTRLLDAKTNRLVLGKALGARPTKEEQALLVSLDAQIEGFEDEIRQRDAAAGTLLPETRP